MRIAFLSLGLLAVAGSAIADEKIKVDDLPKVVLSAVKAKFPEAKLTGAEKEEEDGKEVFEVSLKDGGVEIDVAVSAKGKILEIEKTVDVEKLPKAVAEAIKAKHPKAKIRKAEMVVVFEDGDEDEEEKYFEVELATEGKKGVELKLSPKGKILDDGEEEDDDDEVNAKHAKKKDKKDD